jgi:nitrite reductase (cytochrome c-552)
MSEKSTQSNRTLWLGAAFIGGLLIMAGLIALLMNIQSRKAEAIQYPLQLVEIPNNTLDPKVWAINYPRQYDSFMRTAIDGQQTPYGGSDPYSKLEKYPAMTRLWAGFAFAKDHNEERGHYYWTTDQLNTQRVQLVSQPAACINCHAAELPVLVEELGWLEFNKTPFNDLRDKLHVGASCNDCHDPATMDLRINRPGLDNALKARGIDWREASRQEMRSLVCAQCHVEYYFESTTKELIFPWTEGLLIDDMERYYDNINFRDFVHAETKSDMLKVQHPEYELWSTGLHAESGVSCADCHMPYVREGSVKISDHWIRSPLLNLNQSCGTCHSQSEDQLYNRVLTIQNRTAELLRAAEAALLDASDAIMAAMEAGASDEQLAEARAFFRSGSFRWDFVSSENSTGFHSPQESARVLGMAIDYARQAQLSAERLLP